jgi:hypothetical protein
MKRWSVIAALVVVSFGLLEGRAEAWGMWGHVYCDANFSGAIDEGDLPLSGITITSISPAGVVSTTTTDSGGYFHFFVSDETGTHSVSISGHSGKVIFPTTYPAQVVLTNEASWATDVNFLVSGDACTDNNGLKCWLTGGGTKFNPIIGNLVAEKGPAHNFGGNVNPSCSAEPGYGGQWNHVASNSKLHFMGTTIRVLECGNVPGIDAGSESPVTPFNYIVFEGEGWVKGIQGNKNSYDFVTFSARAEDRNEPGSGTEAKAGAYIDRYFLKVNNPLNPATPLILVDVDGDPSTVDPVTITGGNLQLHISSCTN